MQKTSFVGAKAWFVGVFQIFLGAKIWLIFFQMDCLKSPQLNIRNPPNSTFSFQFQISSSPLYFSVLYHQNGSCFLGFRENVAIGKAILARVQSHKHVGKDYLIGTRCGDRREYVENGSQVLFLKNYPKKKVIRKHLHCMSALVFETIFECKELWRLLLLCF